MRADSAGASLKLRFREYGNGSGTLLASPTTTVTLSTAWRQVSVTDVPAAPGASALDLNAYASSAPPGTCFYADDASITLGQDSQAPSARQRPTRLRQGCPIESREGGVQVRQA